MTVSDTIAAISTPPGEGAIALVRVSGANAIEVGDKIFHGKETPSQFEPHVQHFGEIFGPEGEATVYFRNAKKASECTRALLCSSAERRRLAAGLHRRIVGGAHTYAHRLGTMLEIATCR